MAKTTIALEMVVYPSRKSISFNNTVLLDGPSPKLSLMDCERMVEEQMRSDDWKWMFHSPSSSSSNNNNNNNDTTVYLCKLFRGNVNTTLDQLFASHPHINLKLSQLMERLQTTATTPAKLIFMVGIQCSTTIVLSGWLDINLLSSLPPATSSSSGTGSSSSINNNKLRTNDVITIAGPTGLISYAKCSPEWNKYVVFAPSSSKSIRRVGDSPSNDSEDSIVMAESEPKRMKRDPMDVITTATTAAVNQASASPLEILLDIIDTFKLHPTSREELSELFEFNWKQAQQRVMEVLLRLVLLKDGKNKEDVDEATATISNRALLIVVFALYVYPNDIWSGADLYGLASYLMPPKIKSRLLHDPIFNSPQALELLPIWAPTYYAIAVTTFLQSTIAPLISMTLQRLLQCCQSSGGGGSGTNQPTQQRTMASRAVIRCLDIVAAAREQQYLSQIFEYVRQESLKYSTLGLQLAPLHGGCNGLIPYSIFIRPFAKEYLHPLAPYYASIQLKTTLPEKSLDQQQQVPTDYPEVKLEKLTQLIPFLDEQAAPGCLRYAMTRYRDVTKGFKHNTRNHLLSALFGIFTMAYNRERNFDDLAQLDLIGMEIVKKATEAWFEVYGPERWRYIKEGLKKDEHDFGVEIYHRLRAFANAGQSYHRSCLCSANGSASTYRCPFIKRKKEEKKKKQPSSIKSDDGVVVVIDGDDEDDDDTDELPRDIEELTSALRACRIERGQPDRDDLYQKQPARLMFEAALRRQLRERSQPTIATMIGGGGGVASVAAVAATATGNV